MCFSLQKFVEMRFGQRVERRDVHKARLVGRVGVLYERVVGLQLAMTVQVVCKPGIVDGTNKNRNQVDVGRGRQRPTSVDECSQTTWSVFKPNNK